MSWPMPRRRHTLGMMTDTCTATIQGEPCDKSATVRGLCPGHYQRWRRGADLDAPWYGTTGPGLCSGTFAGEPCDRPARGKGLCDVHHQRLRNGTDLDAPLRILDPTRPCTATIQGEPCDKPYQRNGLCRGHATRLERGQDMDAPWRGEQACSATVEGQPCDKPYSSNGFCGGHLQRWRIGSPPMDAPWNEKQPGRVCEVDGCAGDHMANGLCAKHYQLERFHRERASQVEPNGFTVERLNARLAMFGRTCWVCGQRIPEGDRELHIDHVKPLAMGGAHTPANLRPACAECNGRKGAAWPIDTSTAHLRLDPARLP